MLCNCLTYVTVLLGIALARCSHFGIAAAHLTWRYNSQCHWVLCSEEHMRQRKKTKQFSFPCCTPFVVDLGPRCRQATVKGLLLSITALSLSKVTRMLCIKPYVYHTTAVLLYLQNQRKNDPLKVVSATIPTTAKKQEVFLEGSNCHFIFSSRHLWQNIYLTVAQAVLWAGV